MPFWLVKSEPTVYSIDNLKKDQITRWDSIRNYQARNFLKQMGLGDSVLFYHSSSEPSGVAGLAKVVKAAYPDPTQFAKQSEYFDPKASVAAPRWFSPDLKFVKKFSHFVTISELRNSAALKNMELLRRGSRLSVQALTEKEFGAIMNIAGEER